MFIQTSKPKRNKTVFGTSYKFVKATPSKITGMGAKVVLAARRENGLKIVEDEIKQKGGDCLSVKT